MFDLSQKAALVTGAADGIGAAIARRFRAAGARVVITDIRDASELAAEIGARYLYMDVGDEASVAGALDEATDKEGPLDILVNNAGIGDVGESLENLDAGGLERITRVNQFGVAWGLKHGPAYMNDGGSIINTASLAAKVAMAGSAAYSASKAAVVSMTAMSALELGDRGIRVNAVCPAYVATALGSGTEGEDLMQNFTALGRVATTDDLVGIFHFLASDESAFISGQAINVDGGWSAGPSKALLEQVIGSAGVN